MLKKMPDSGAKFRDDSYMNYLHVTMRGVCRLLATLYHFGGGNKKKVLK